MLAQSVHAANVVSTRSAPAPTFSLVEVVQVVDDIGVVAEAAEHPIGSGEAIETVIAGATGQAIVAAIAGADKVTTAGEGQLLDEWGEGVAGERRLDAVDAAAGDLGHHVGGGVDYVGVVAVVAGQPVDAQPTIQPVCSGATGDGVVGGVAGTDEDAAADEGEVLEIGGKSVAAARRANRVDAAAGCFDDGVATAVEVGVVADAADHAVGAEGAIEAVVAGATVERVVAGAAIEIIAADAAGDDIVDVIAGPGERAGAGEHHVLDVGAQLVDLGNRADDIDPLAVLLEGDVGDVVDDVGVAASPADKRILASAAVENVGVLVAVDVIGQSAASDPVLAGRAVVDRHRQFSAARSAHRRPIVVAPPPCNSATSVLPIRRIRFTDWLR